MCMSVLPTCVCVYHMFAVPADERTRQQISWNWHYRWLLAAMWVVGTKPRLSGRATSILNH